LDVAARLAKPSNIDSTIVLLAAAQALKDTKLTKKNSKNQHLPPEKKD
jgi:hypothetical protein